MVDEKITRKEQWYDVKRYKDEIRQFVLNKRNCLNQTSKMNETYKRLYSTVYAGTEEADVERFPHTAEVFKVYKAALIEACLQGYSALYTISGLDGYSTLKIPELNTAMTQQFKSMALIENLSAETVDDWIMKGEAVGFLKLKENREEYRIKQTLIDEETGQELIEFKIKEGVEYEDLEFERIDPLDFYVDAVDYKKDPLGCPKIIRSFITAKDLLSSDAYPLLSREEKIAIIERDSNRNDGPIGGFYRSDWARSGDGRGQTRDRQIEVLTYRGDYVTLDNKVLRNIVAVCVENQIADVKYSEVSTNRVIYAPYTIDRWSHRGVSPLASSNPVNKLMNRAIDMFIKNLEDLSVPYILFQKGTINKPQWDNFKKEKKLEYVLEGTPPEFWTPPAASAAGIDLLQMIINQNKNMLGLNSYMAGDTRGAVRTAEESSILYQKANARMRVETDVFSYNFMLNLITAFYSFNRELALAIEHPLADIYADPMLKISISTNASKADEQGELNMLMQMLNLPIAQMIFSNLTPQQTILAVRYLMAKANLKDADNLLELVDENGQTTQMPALDGDGNPVDIAGQDNPPQEMDMDIQMSQMPGMNNNGNNL